ncbi:NADH-quinone oxidoreductase subunit NuoH [soil metagenome]
MGKDGFEISVNVLKMFVIFLGMVQAVPVLVWLERRGSAFIQNRTGPNRVGPLGLIQLLADAVKFLFKQPFVPEKGVAPLYYFAPVMALIPGALALNSIPLSTPIKIETFEMFGRMFGPYTFLFQGYDMGIGIVFILGISSLGVYSILLAGWGSSNKYSLMGAVRGAAQGISYELALSLSLVGILMVYGTLSFKEIVDAQQGPLTFMAFGKEHALAFLPNWGIFFQPLGALIFFAATFAESNRLPFDLPEAEGELVAGFHTEYGGFNLLLFYIGEYGHMMVASALLATFYFGGYSIPWTTPEEVMAFWQVKTGGANLASILTAVTFMLSLLVRIAFFLWIFIHVRWTLPRFRYDHLMSLGWKTMLPWALCNVVVTAIWLWLGHKV